MQVVDSLAQVPVTRHAPNTMTTRLYFGGNSGINDGRPLQADRLRVQQHVPGVQADPVFSVWSRMANRFS